MPPGCADDRNGIRVPVDSAPLGTAGSRGGKNPAGGSMCFRRRPRLGIGGAGPGGLRPGPLNPPPHVCGIAPPAFCGALAPACSSSPPCWPPGRGAPSTSRPGRPSRRCGSSPSNAACRSAFPARSPRACAPTRCAANSRRRTPPPGCWPAPAWVWCVTPGPAPIRSCGCRRKKTPAGLSVPPLPPAPPAPRWSPRTESPPRWARIRRPSCSPRSRSRPPRTAVTRRRRRSRAAG